MDAAALTISSSDIIIIDKRYGTSETPTDILYEEPEIIGYRTLVGHYETLTWKEANTPNRISRDPFMGLAIENKNNKKGTYIGSYYWKGHFLGYCSTPIHVVLDKYSNRNFEDFCKSLFRLETRMRCIRLIDRLYFDLEFRKFLSASESMDNKVASCFLYDCLMRVS